MTAFNEAINKAASTTINKTPAFHGEHAVVIVLQEASALPQVEVRTQTAKAHRFSPFAEQKAIAEANCRFEHGRSIQHKIPEVRQTGYQLHAGTATINYSNCSLHIGVSGIEPSPELIDTLGPEVTGYPGFFDQLLAEQVRRHRLDPHASTDIPLPGFLKFIKSGGHVTRNHTFAKQFIDFNK